MSQRVPLCSDSDATVHLSRFICASESLHMRIRVALYAKAEQWMILGGPPPQRALYGTFRRSKMQQDAIKCNKMQ